MTAYVIEQVTFALEDGITHEVFLRAIGRSNVFLESCPGFIQRFVGKKADADVWIDVVLWESMRAALDAANRFNSSQDTREFNHAIRRGSTAMSHYELCWSYGGEVVPRS
jgi:hypothetical protein